MAKPTKSKRSSQTGSKADSSPVDAEKIEDAVVVDEDPGKTPLADATDELKSSVKDAAASAKETVEAVMGDDIVAKTDGNADAPEAKPEAKDDSLASDATDKLSTQDDTTADLSDSTGPSDSVAAANSDDTIGSDSQASAVDTPVVPTATVVQEKIIEKKGGFVPMVLGGLVAAGIGFGGAQVLGPDYWIFGAQDAGPDPFQAEMTQQLSAQSEQLNTLSGRVDGAEAAIGQIDTASLAAAIEDQTGALGGVQSGLTELQGTLAGLDDRLTTLEKRPVTEAVSPEAIAAYERELEALRNDITAQRTEIESLAAEAVAAEQSANTQAALAQGRAALAEVMSAVDNGAPMAGALATLSAATGLEAPPELAAVASDGVPPLGALIEDFPAAARDALAAARRDADADAGEAEGGLGGFLSRQLGARSLTPQEGSSPDAVLSRAEAAVRNGDLKTALTEIQALPESGQAALSDWVSQASARVGALDAAAALSQQLNSSE